MSDPATATPAESTALVSRVPVAMGIAPTNVDEGWRLAQMLARGDEMVPKQYRGKPEAIMIAIQMGIEIGFAPMQALQSIAVIGGRPGVWGDGMLALVISSPHYEDHDEYFEVEVDRPEVLEGKKIVRRVMEKRDGLTVADLKVDSTVAVCTFWRRGKKLPVSRRFSVGQARTANYLGRGDKGGGKEGPWQTHPDRMLQMRARSFSARDTFPDVLRGIRTVEELRDIEGDEREALPPPREVRRLSVIERVPEAAVTTPEPPPPAELTTVGPCGVGRVEQLLGGLCAFLTDGSQVWVTPQDATELEKFIGTSHRLTFSVEPVDGAKRVVSFAIAE